MKKVAYLYLTILILVFLFVAYSGIKNNVRLKLPSNVITRSAMSVKDKLKNAQNYLDSNKINPNKFSETDAISMVIKDHPDFPINPNNIIIKKLPIGGPPGEATNVKFTTKVEKQGNFAYVITFIKDWGIKINGIYAKSFWKYKVTPNGIELIENVDNDYLPTIVIK